MCVFVHAHVLAFVRESVKVCVCEKKFTLVGCVYASGGYGVGNVRAGMVNFSV